MFIILNFVLATRGVLKIENIPQSYLGNIQSREAFRPITRERKYLMDYNHEQFTGIINLILSWLH